VVPLSLPGGVIYSALGAARPFRVKCDNCMLCIHACPDAALKIQPSIGVES
jgi:ferredoxin